MQPSYINLYTALIIGIMAVSTSAVLVTMADTAPAAIIANYRLLFAVILMSPVILLKYRQEFMKITKIEWIFSILAGVFLAAHFILWFESLNYTSVTSSVVLVSLQPIFAFFGTYLFFNERFSFHAMISMIIAIIGSIMISWGDFQLSGMALFGDFLAILGAISITVYFLLGQKVRKNVSLMTYTFVVYGISSITLIFYNIIFNHSFTGYPVSHWWIFLTLAVIPTFLGHSIFNWALKWLSTSTISMANIFEPVGASILAYVLLGEQINSSQLIGGTIVLLGLSLFILNTPRSQKIV